jgi:formyltetrahydrofolate synthetase
VGRVVAGKPLDPALTTENLGAVRAGGTNLTHCVGIVRVFGIPALVAINAFPTDTAAEHALIREIALEAGASDAVVCTNWAEGGKGAEDLARAVWAAASDGGHDFRLLYPDDMPLREKIELIATRVYGADGVELAPAAAKSLAEYTALGYGHLPVCMAKTHLSLSHDPAVKGRPTGYRFPIREVRLAAGAGFIYPLAGEMRTMPGLPSHPAGEKIDIDADGNVVGLF